MIDAKGTSNEILSRLTAAWNAGDGAAFGAPFTEGAHFIDIRGAYHRGGVGIGHGHQAIFDSIYKGSTIAIELLDASSIADDLIFAVARSTLNAPSGPLAGTSNATFSMVLKREGTAWRVFAFQNTMVKA